MKERFIKNGVFSLEYDKETLRDMVLTLQEENQELKKQLEELQETHYLIQGGRGYGKTYLMKLKSELK